MIILCSFCHIVLFPSSKLKSYSAGYTPVGVVATQLRVRLLHPGLEVVSLLMIIYSG